MPEIYTIKDERTVYCRKAMKANGGEWNPLTRVWMFRDEIDHANALAELYRATRLSVPMLEALQTMISDGTGALAWGFDPAEQPLVLDDLDRNEASKLLAAGYAVRRVLGVHPMEDAEQLSNGDVFEASGFETRARGRKPRRRNLA